MSLREKAKKVEVVEEKNIYLSEVKKGLELCANIMSLGDMAFENDLKEIDEILKKFMLFAENDTNKMSIRVYKELVAFKDDLINILNFPQLENHYTVAVGGGFSAGKSTFLNQVLGLHKALPTDTNPTTSISSYITKSKQQRFIGLNKFHNMIELDKDAIQAISHAFYKKYNLSFSHILKLISIEEPNLKYDNIVFLDTPGYSKSDAIDENVAREHLRATDFLIWLVDAQTSISSSDLTFIQTLGLEHPMLVVLNKADKRTKQDLDALVAKTKESLENKNIPFYDVVAYSSSKNIEYSSSQNIIHTYLTTIASKSIGTKLMKRLEDVFKLYIDYYDSQLMEYRTTRRIFNEMLMKEAVSEEYFDEIKTLNTKRQRQIQAIENAKKNVMSLHKNLQDILKKLLSDAHISMCTYKKEYVFAKEFYENVQKHIAGKDFRFSASIYLKDPNALLKFSNVDAIDAYVHKISSIGVFIHIKGVNGDLMIAKNKILEHDAIEKVEDVFKENDKVLVQITNSKKCVVII